MTMLISEHAECLQESLNDLREDARLLQITLRGVRTPADELTMNCLIRLTDYLDQHVNDVCVLCKNLAFSLDP